MFLPQAYTNNHPVRDNTTAENIILIRILLLSLSLLEKNHDNPRHVYNIIHAMLKTHAGGLNLTTLPASLPTLQNAAVTNPNIAGINIVEYKAIRSSVIFIPI